MIVTESSFPYFHIAKKYGVDYGDVLWYASYIEWVLIGTVLPDSDLRVCRSLLLPHDVRAVINLQVHNEAVRRERITYATKAKHA